MGADPTRDHTQLRAIVGDCVGLYLVCRRFEGGRLRDVAAFVRDPHATEISTAELSLLLEGANFTVHQRATAWRQPRKAPLHTTIEDPAAPHR